MEPSESPIIPTTPNDNEITNGESPVLDLKTPAKQLDGTNNELPPVDFEEFKTFLDSQVFSVHDMLLADEDNFNMYFDKFYTYMKQGFEREEVRTYPIKFRFTSNEAEPIKTMIYWLPFIKMGRVEELNSSHILDPKQLTNSYTENWINTLIIDPYRKFYSNKKMNRIVERILYMKTMMHSYNGFYLILQRSILI